MGWRCDICDSYNETGSMQCYVCGQPRSPESIREEKERRKEERIAQVNALLFNRVYSIVKSIMAISIFLSVTVVAIISIRIIVDGELDGARTSFLTIGRFAEHNIHTLFHSDIFMICYTRAIVSIESIPRIFASIWASIGVGSLERYRLTAKAIGQIIKENTTTSFYYGFKLLWSRLALNALRLVGIVRSLFINSKDSIKYFTSIISNIFNSASKHFN